jgi:hypothetical protein
LVGPEGADVRRGKRNRMRPNSQVSEDGGKQGGPGTEPDMTKFRATDVTHDRGNNSEPGREVSKNSGQILNPLKDC